MEYVLFGSGKRSAAFDIKTMKWMNLRANVVSGPSLYINKGTVQKGCFSDFNKKVSDKTAFWFIVQCFIFFSVLQNLF